MSKPNKKGGFVPPSKPVIQTKGSPVTTEESTSTPADATPGATEQVNEAVEQTSLRGATRTGFAIDDAPFQSIKSEEDLLPPGALASNPGANFIAGLDALKQEEIAAKEAALGLNLFTEELKEHIRKLLADGSPLVKLTMNELLDYIRQMAPRSPVDDIRGGQYQVRFYRAIVNIINNGPTDFRLFFGVFLRMVHELRSEHVFNERYLMRFLPTMPMDERDRRGFQYLMNLFATTADSATRAQVLRQTDLGKAVSSGLTDVGQKRLISYYQA